MFWVLLVGSEIFSSSVSGSTTRGPTSFSFWDIFCWFGFVVFLYHDLSDFNGMFCWLGFVVFWDNFCWFGFVVFLYHDLSDVNGIFCWFGFVVFRDISCWFGFVVTSLSARSTPARQDRAHGWPCHASACCSSKKSRTGQSGNACGCRAGPAGNA